MSTKKLILRAKITKLLVTILLLDAMIFAIPIAQAAQVTSLSDNMSRLKASTLSDHTIIFASPTGIAAGQTVTLTFGSAFSMGTFNVNNVDFATGSSSNCALATYTEQTLAATPSGSTWGIAQAGQVITLTSGTGTSAAGNCVRFKIGANATTGGAGVTQITNGSAGDTNAIITIGGTFGDTGTLFIPIISNDQVTVTATVNPTISFAISANSINFGTLNSAAAQFANTTSGSNTEVVAHTLTASTNATSGYNIYVLGDTLRSGSNFIAAIGGSMASSTPGTAQFGFRASASGGSGSVLPPYNGGTSYAFGASTTTQSTVAQATAPSTTTTYSLYYVANISPITPAGTYSTTLTYTAVGNF